MAQSSILMYCETCRTYLGWLEDGAHIFCGYAYCVGYCPEHCPKHMDGTECNKEHPDCEDED